MVPRSPFIALLLPLFALSLSSCSHKGEVAKTDVGATDAAVTVLDAGPSVAPPPAPENVNEVGRFPDEQALGNVAAKIADPNVSARNAVPGGVLVATLRIGTPVTQIATHDKFILCIFPDPKNATHDLEGWVAEQAFVPGPTVPSKAACGTGQTRLMIDEQDFCGRVCKNDSDCTSGQACIGKASLFANGKMGADVTTCTIPSSGAPAAGGGSTGKIVPGIQQAPLAGGSCLPNFVMGPDKLCHHSCSGGCPAGSKCAHALGQSLCEAQ
jgi:hypothetical protein